MGFGRVERDAEVDLVAQDLFDHGIGAADLDPEMNAGIRLAKRSEAGREFGRPR
jgi:hypothetical protein